MTSRDQTPEYVTLIQQIFDTTHEIQKQSSEQGDKPLKEKLLSLAHYIQISLISLEAEKAKRSTTGGSANAGLNHTASLQDYESIVTQLNSIERIILDSDVFYRTGKIDTTDKEALVLFRDYMESMFRIIQSAINLLMYNTRTTSSLDIAANGFQFISGSTLCQASPGKQTS